MSSTQWELIKLRCESLEGEPHDFFHHRRVGQRGRLPSRCEACRIQARKQQNLEAQRRQISRKREHDPEGFAAEQRVNTRHHRMALLQSLPSYDACPDTVREIYEHAARTITTIVEHISSYPQPFLGLITPSQESIRRVHVSLEQRIDQSGKLYKETDELMLLCSEVLCNLGGGVGELRGLGDRLQELEKRLAARGEHTRLAFNQLVQADYYRLHFFDTQDEKWLRLALSSIEHAFDLLRGKRHDQKYTKLVDMLLFEGYRGRIAIRGLDLRNPEACKDDLEALRRFLGESTAKDWFPLQYKMDFAEHCLLLDTPNSVQQAEKLYTEIVDEFRTRGHNPTPSYLSFLRLDILLKDRQRHNKWDIEELINKYLHILQHDDASRHGVYYLNLLLKMLHKPIRIDSVVPVTSEYSRLWFPFSTREVIRTSLTL